jgi:large subunit ribosomal protein L13
MNTTVRIKQSQVYKDWHVIDAAGRPLGRVATEAATLLKGKHKPTYEPHLDDGDFVIIVNASQVTRSGNKADQDVYYRHSGYPGGLKKRTYADMLEKFPERVLEQAVWGMLPKGPLGKQMFRHLKVYKGPSHPHASQIASTATAQEARKTALAEAITTAPKLKRLRPLSVPQVHEAEDEKVAKKQPSAASTAARQARERVRGTAPAAPAEEEVTAAAAEAPAPVAEAPAAEAPVRAPRRKAADAEATAATATEEAPKRAPRRKAATAEADASAEATTEEKKPARRRAAAKSEGTEE